MEKRTVKLNDAEITLGNKYKDTLLGVTGIAVDGCDPPGGGQEKGRQEEGRTCSEPPLPSTQRSNKRCPRPDHLAMQPTEHIGNEYDAMEGAQKFKFNDVRSTCCEQCPYARTTPKEYLDTRGQNGHRFVAQAHMDALLPCHMDNAEGMADSTSKARQCAGAAKFRANIGQEREDEERFPRLPKDEETVFGNEAQLLAHHLGHGLTEVMTQPIVDAKLEDWILWEKIEAIGKDRFVTFVRKNWDPKTHTWRNDIADRSEP